MQACIWPSWCHCHSLSRASVNPDWLYLSGTGSPGYSRKTAIKCVCVFPLILSFQKIDSPICWYSVLSGIRCCCWTASHSQDDDQVGWTVSNSVRQWNCSRQTQTVSSACWHFSSFSSSVIPRLQCCKTLCSDCPKSCRVRMQIYFSAFNFGESKLHHSNTRVISVKNWRILLVQSFTALADRNQRIQIRERRWSLPQLLNSVIYAGSIPYNNARRLKKNCKFHRIIQGIMLPRHHNIF